MSVYDDDWLDAPPGEIDDDDVPEDDWLDAMDAFVEDFVEDVIEGDYE